MDIDLYGVLGVDKRASHSEIEKAFAKKSKTIKDNDMISVARDILTNPVLKKIYDEEGLEKLTDFMDDLIDRESYEEEVDLFEESEYEEPENYELDVSLNQLYKGAVLILEISKVESCIHCHGDCFANTCVFTCPRCNGIGGFISKASLDVGKPVFIKCINCMGSGEIEEAIQCKVCNGSGMIKKKVDLPIKIFPGMIDGTVIRIEHGVKVMICEMSHPYFYRKGIDLCIKKVIGVTESLCGFVFAIRHLDDRVLIVHSPKGKVITHNEVMCIEGEGFPSVENGGKGNLYIKFIIKFPTRTQINCELEAELLKLHTKQEIRASPKKDSAELKNSTIEDFGKYAIPNEYYSD